MPPTVRRRFSWQLHSNGLDIAVFTRTHRTLAWLLLPFWVLGCSGAPNSRAESDGGMPTSGSSSTSADTSTGSGFAGSASGTTGMTSLGGAAGASTTGSVGTTGAGMGGAGGSGGGTGSGGSGGMPAASGDTTQGSVTTGAAGSGGAEPDLRDRYFGDWPDGADPATIGGQLAAVFRDENLAGSKHYKVACAWYGALGMSGLLGDQAMVESLVAKYQPYANTWSELLGGAGHVDENVFGIVPLEISMQTIDSLYLNEGLSLADHQQANIESQKRFAIDDMFMITALQVQAYRASGDAKYIDLASSVMIEYLDRLQQEDGLFHHHEDFFHKWARGNGWFAVGMAEVLAELPVSHANYGAIREGYELMMQGLASYQLSEGAGAGLWQQIVDSTDERNWPETSGSAMFTYALVSGVRHGWLDVETYGPRARAAWIALVGRLTPAGLLQDISDWAYLPSSHPGGPSYAGDEENYYFERPKLIGDNHGQAPMLWSAGALVRPLDE